MTDSPDSRLDDALARFATAQDGPNPPDLETFLADYPDLADALRDTLRPLAAVQGIVRAATVLVERVGPYRLLRVIGRGGMGVVYEAEDTTVQRRVAVKVLSADGLDRAGRDALLREARIAAALQHPGVVPILSAGEADGAAFIAMRLIDGRSLSAVLRARREADGGGIDPREAADLGRQAADALAFVHENGVLHRDVKPGNLLWDADGRLWLTDFGLARSARPADGTLGGRVGTPRYASPEQRAGDPLDGRTDVYSLGVTLYELLTLRPAFPAELPAGVARREPPPVRLLAPTVPADLATAVHKAMAERPGDRYPSAAEFAGDLARFLAGEPVRARPLSRWQRAGRWAVRRRKPLALAAVMLFAGLAAGGLLAWRGYERESAARRELESREEILRELLREVNKTEAVFRHLPQGQAEHRRLVQALKEVVCRWADEPTATFDTRTEAVRACIRLGELDLNDGRTDDGLASVEEAIRRVTDLRAADAADPDLRFLLARGHQYRARGTQRFDAERSLADVAAAMQLLDALIADHPDRAEYRNPLSHLAATVAHARSERGEYRAAVEMLLKGLASDEWLQRKYPDGHPQSYIRLSGTWRTLGREWSRTGDWDEAERAYREAVRNDLVLSEPRFVHAKTARDTTQCARIELARFLIASGKSADQRELLTAAARDADGFARDFPDRRSFAELAWWPHLLLGQWEYIAGNAAAARNAFRQALGWSSEAAQVRPDNRAFVRLHIPYPDLLDGIPAVSPDAPPLPRIRHAVAVAQSGARADLPPIPLHTLPPDERAEAEYLLALRHAVRRERTEALALKASADRLAAALPLFRPEGRVARRQLDEALNALPK